MGIDVGQRRPSGWGPVVVIAIVWGILIVITTQMVWDSVQRTAPKVASLTYNVSLQKPGSGDYTQIVIEGDLEKYVVADASFLASSVLPKTKLTLMTAQGPVGTLSFDLATNTYSYTAPSGDQSSPQVFQGQATLHEWMSRCTGRSSPQLQAEAADVAALLRTSMNQHRDVLNIQNGNISGSTSYSGSNYMNTWSMTGQGAFASANGTAAVATRLPIWYAMTIVSVRRTAPPGGPLWWSGAADGGTGRGW